MEFLDGKVVGSYDDKTFVCSECGKLDRMSKYAPSAAEMIMHSCKHGNIYQLEVPDTDGFGGVLVASDDDKLYAEEFENWHEKTFD